VEPAGSNTPTPRNLRPGPASGQIWTTLDKLAADAHELVHQEPEPGIHRLHREPGFAIGQRTYLVQTEQSDLPWDPPN
jgi:hypothetical protein